MYQPCWEAPHSLYAAMALAALPITFVAALNLAVTRHKTCPQLRVLPLAGIQSAVLKAAAAALVSLTEGAREVAAHRRAIDKSLDGEGDARLAEADAAVRRCGLNTSS